MGPLVDTRLKKSISMGGSCKMRGPECGELVKTKMRGSLLRGIRAGCRRNCEVRGVSLAVVRLTAAASVVCDLESIA